MRLLILILFTTLFSFGQTEYNTTGSTISNGAYSVDLSMSFGFDNLISNLSNNFKIGPLQPSKTFIISPNSDTLKIFNFVTANGDSKNDFFTIEGLQKIQNYELTIFNRLGNIILNTRQYENDWNGQDLEAGTYFYLFKYDNQELKNVIFLSR